MGDRDPAARVRDEAGERPIFPCCLPTYVAPRHISCAKILRTDGIVLGITIVCPMEYNARQMEIGTLSAFMKRQRMSPDEKELCLTYRPKTHRRPRRYGVKSPRARPLGVCCNHLVSPCTVRYVRVCISLPICSAAVYRPLPPPPRRRRSRGRGEGGEEACASFGIKS